MENRKPKNSLTKEGPSDFVRPEKRRRLNTRPDPIEVDLHRTAVIVVDMQNAFVSKGGMFDVSGMDISAAGRVIEMTKKIIDTARKAGCKIVFLKMSYEPDYSNSGGVESPNWHKELGLSLMRKNPENWGKFVTRGSWDEEICEALEVKPGDMIVRKQRYSGFSGTNLDGILRAYNTRYCIYTGVATNVCVESTLRDGYFLDYWPILVSDAINNAGPEITQQATLWNVERLFGWVIDTESLLEGISGISS
jgi:ureidoacrylate peracid hydrolase